MRPWRAGPALRRVVKALLLGSALLLAFGPLASVLTQRVAPRIAAETGWISRSFFVVGGASGVGITDVDPWGTPFYGTRSGALSAGPNGRFDGDPERGLAGGDDVLVLADLGQASGWAWWLALFPSNALAFVLFVWAGLLAWQGEWTGSVPREEAAVTMLALVPSLLLILHVVEAQRVFLKEHRLRLPSLVPPEASALLTLVGLSLLSALGLRLLTREPATGAGPSGEAPARSPSSSP